MYQSDMSNPNTTQFLNVINKISNHSNFINEDIDISHLLNNIVSFNPDIKILNKSIPQHSAQFTDIQYAYEIGKNPKIELGGTHSQFCIALEVHNVDLVHLKACWDKLYELHPMLRAYSNESGRQKILEFDKAQEYFRWNKEPQINDKSLWANHLMKAFFTSKTPQKTMLQVQEFSDDSQGMFFYFDLMFIDIRSIWTLLRDLDTLYLNQEKPKLNYTFFDYIEQEKNFKEHTQGKLDKSYWMSMLGKMEPAPDIPLQVQPSQIEQVCFKQKTITLQSHQIEQLRIQAGKNDLSAEALILSCYVEVLRRWSKKQSFTITNANLTRYSFDKNIENVVGNFLKPNLLMIDDSQGKTFKERSLVLQRTLIESKIHSSFNGIELLREYIKNTNDKRMLSIPCVFSNCLNSDLQNLDSNGIFQDAKILLTKTCTPQVWLENQILAINDTLQINWNYIDGLFHEDVIQGMFNAFNTLIHTLIDDENHASLWEQKTIVAKLPLQDALEQHQSNDTTLPFQDDLLISPILRQSKRTPHAIAIEQGQLRYTYSDIIQSAYQLSQRIQSQIEIKPNDMIIVSIPQSVELIVAILATLISGAAYVAVAPDLPYERKKHIISKCGAKVILSVEPLLDDYWTLDSVDFLFGVVITKETHDIDYEKIISQLKQQPRDLAYVIFTSGSTGEPKGVMINHSNALNTILDINSKFSVSAHDAVLSVAPPNFDLSVYDYFGLLSAGGKIVFLTDPTNLDPRYWWDEVQNHQVTIWNSVPAPFKLLIDRNLERLNETNLRLALMSGDWIPLDIPQTILNKTKKIQLISLGGATEGSIWSIYFPITAVEDTWKSIPYGYPLANQRFYVLNDWSESVPKHVTGELYIAGLGVAQGYLADSDKTASHFIQHPTTNERLYRTGDLGRYLKNGMIEILGREDNQIKINGYRIELGEIEYSILKFKKINHVVLDLIEHKDSKQKQLIAYYVANESIEVNVAELKGFLSTLLPSYMIPTYFIQVTNIPLTANGKVSKKALPKPWDIYSKEVSHEEAEELGDHGKVLFTLLTEELKHHNFNHTQGFFDIGGDSLHAIGFISLIKTKFEIDEDLEQSILEHLFMNSSIKEVAQLFETSSVI